MDIFYWLQIVSAVIFGNFVTAIGIYSFARSDKIEKAFGRSSVPITIILGGMLPAAVMLVGLFLIE